MCHMYENLPAIFERGIQVALQANLLQISMETGRKAVFQADGCDILHFRHGKT